VAKKGRRERIMWVGKEMNEKVSGRHTALRAYAGIAGGCYKVL
jgi:hypothetical protein